jgi:hypothetical protein
MTLLKIRRKPASPLKRWSDKRNFEKFKLLGVLGSLNNYYTLTDNEKLEMKYAIYFLRSLKNSWDTERIIAKENFLRSQKL